ncbi:hypothetical protein BKK79_37240 (plasmid) [Cupriavidus sp. USMAA2-4]|uniref:PRTRC system protein A n=1 Tax=Cupriavidus sp. USMAA2-4 TaxID=876364 RepID=UPI0008A6C831|nr:PRTRC system protein A [Cupriavidus sp. USMAA2-4]AOY97583.1 hypothetical protein BKK79_37240 [Cupriavidus sp. USMAA2-4]
MNARDMTLQASFPTIEMPRFEPLPPLARPGERLVVGSNGLFLEISRPWIHLVRRIAAFNVPTAIPYGAVVAATDFRCGRVPPDLVEAFARLAREAFPLETAAWVVWNENTLQFRLQRLTLPLQGPNRLEYERPRLPAGDHIVIDCHSHGAHGAGFSPTDDADDRFDVKLAAVLGHCNRPRMSVAMRLCAKGIFETFHKLPAAWRSAADRDHETPETLHP